MLRAPVAAPSPCTAAAPSLSSCLSHCLLPVLSTDPSWLKLESRFPFSLSCFWLLLLFLSGLSFVFFAAVSSDGFPAVSCDVFFYTSSAVSCLLYSFDIFSTVSSANFPTVSFLLNFPLTFRVLFTVSFTANVSSSVPFSFPSLLLLHLHYSCYFHYPFTTSSAISYSHETVSLHLLSPIPSPFLLYLFTFLLFPVHCPVNSFISTSLPHLFLCLLPSSVFPSPFPSLASFYNPLSLKR